MPDPLIGATTSQRLKGDAPLMSSTKWLNAFALGLAAVAVGMVALKNYRGNEQGQILNVSYDPSQTSTLMRLHNRCTTYIHAIYPPLRDR